MASVVDIPRNLVLVHRVTSPRHFEICRFLQLDNYYLVKLRQEGLQSLAGGFLTLELFINRYLIPCPMYFHHPMA